MELIKVLTLSLALLLVGTCSESSTSNDDDDNNNTELEINNYLQIASGQVTGYDNDGAVISGLSAGDALFGQDAHYKKGAEMSYQNNGDGTITDLNTGLMWQKVPSSSDYSW